MQLTINPADEVPIYRQIMRQITDAIAGGRLVPGEKLTSHRDLSEQLVVAPLTVKKAYDELEALGFIETQRGRGTFVCVELPEPDRRAQTRQLHASARGLLAQAYLAGLGFSDVLKIMKGASRELRRRSGRPQTEEEIRMTPILEFRNTARSFKKGTPVLADVSFSMDVGEVVALLGRNGTGKTTLIQIAMGMLFPQSGSVRVFGLDPTKEPVAVKKRIGYVAEDQVLPPGSSIAGMIAFHRFLFPMWDDDLAQRLVERFGLPLQSKIGRLSKGQARQVALLCAVCHRPELLILDEPGGGLDPAARREFLETSIQLLNREGTAILFSSHHMSDVERLGGRVVLLDRGRVLLDRPLDEIREGHCVAMIPRRAVASVAALEGLPGCLRARPVFDGWHAVFQGTTEGVRRLVHTSLGATDVRCVSTPLEELFVELLGGDRATEAAS